MALYSVHLKDYENFNNLLNTVYTIQYIVYSIQCTLYSVHYTVYTVHCTVYSAHTISLHSRLVRAGAIKTLLRIYTGIEIMAKQYQGPIQGWR